MVATLTVFIMYLCVSINFVGWRNESKIERGVSHDGTTASAAPTMHIKFSVLWAMPGHPPERHTLFPEAVAVVAMTMPEAAPSNNSS